MKSGNKLEKFTRYQILVTSLLALLQFTIIIDFSIISPLGDMLMHGLAINPAEFSLLVSCYAFGAGSAGIVTAFFADKFDRKKLLLFFYGGFIVGTLLCGSVQTYYLLLSARSITGIFGGVISSISFAIVADLFSLNQRGRVMGYIQMAFSGSQILGIPLGLVIANYWGWQEIFIIIALFSSLIWLIIAIWINPLKNNENQSVKSNSLVNLWRVLSNKNYLFGFCLVLCISLGSAMLMPFNAIFLINNVNLTQQQLPAVYMSTGIVMLIIMPFIGRLSDRFEKIKIFVIASMLAIIMTITFTHLTPLPLIAVIIINIVMFVSIAGRMTPAMALNTAIPAHKDKGSYLSLCSSLQNLSNGLASVIAGLIIIQPAKSAPILNFDSLGFIVAAFNALSIYFIYRIHLTLKKQESFSVASGEIKTQKAF